MKGWVIESTDPPLVFRIARKSVKSIGRAARADFIVDAALISRLHCKVIADASDQLVVEDLDSTNGTRVNGKVVKRAVLKAGDTLTVGRVTFSVATV